MGCQGLIIGACGLLSTAGDAWGRPGFGVITRPDFCAWWGKAQVRQAWHSTDGQVGQVQALMGGGAELGRRVMGGVGAMGTREREEEFVSIHGAVPSTNAWRNSYERMAQLARAHGATRTSVGRALTRDHERSREKKISRKRQEIRGRMFTGRQLLVRLLQVGGRAQAGGWIV